MSKFTPKEYEVLRILSKGPVWTAHDTTGRRVTGAIASRLVVRELVEYVPMPPQPISGRHNTSRLVQLTHQGTVALAGHAPCPTCAKIVPTTRDADGLGRRLGPVRVSPHAGNRWGRMCPGGGEVILETATAKASS